MTASVAASSSHAPVLARALAWLTLERLGYVAIGLLALVLRLASLGGAPLGPAEASQAMAALDLAANRSALPAAGSSPLLLHLHGLLFLLAQANESSARLIPALAGAALVLLAYGLRAELGRLGALGAALLLAISTTLVFWSRQAGGESLALLAGMALVVGLAGWRRSPGRGWAIWLAATLALLLLSAPIAYSILLAAAPLAAMALRPAGQPRPAAAGLAVAGLALVLLLLLGATGLFFQPGGLAATADLPAAWLAGFGGSGLALRSFAASSGIVSSDIALANSVLGLGLKLLWLEPLTLALGLAGLAVNLRPRQAPDAADRSSFTAHRSPFLAVGLGLWLALALLLLLLRAGRTPADLAVAILPLALLGGLALARLARYFDLGEHKAEGVALLIGGLIVLASAAVWLAQYTESWKGEPQTVFLVSAGAVLVILLAIFGIYALFLGRRLALQIGLALALLALLVLSLRGMLLVNFNRDGLRWGSLAAEIGASDAAELPRSLARLATQRGADLHDLPVAFLTAPGSETPSLLRWYARGAAAGSPAVDGANLVWLGMESDAAPGDSPSARPSSTGSGGGYSGQSFRLAQSWSPDGLAGRALLRWLLFGQFDTLQGQQRAVLWVAAGGER
jgi:4-amino-4-deoxy-L-arabinose transferase-like glycosyltransferase